MTWLRIVYVTGESIVWQATVYEGWSEPNFENLDHTLKPMLLPNSVHNPRVFGWLFFNFLVAIKSSQLWYIWRCIAKKYRYVCSFQTGNEASIHVDMQCL